MKKIIAILLLTVMALAAIMPVALGAKKYIDKNSNYMKTWDTEAVIDPNYNGGQSGGDPPGDGGTTDPNAPVVKYCFILPDEDDQKDCVQIHITPSDWRMDIYAYLVVRDPEGRDDIFQVFAQVFHPRDVPPWCGSEKFKATEFDYIPLTTDEIIDAIDDALLSGHLTKAEYDDIIHEVFEKPEAYVYCIRLPMEYCEPAGIYKVRMWATDSDCSSSEICYALFEWKPCVVVEYDFTKLDFGKIEADVEKVIIGDETMETPGIAGNGAGQVNPTLKNEGNTKVHIQIKSEEMTHTEYDQYKIPEFDVYWMGQYYVYNSDGQSGDWTAWLELCPDLCLCQTKQIDFSIHPKHNLPPGTYVGKLTMHISKGDWGDPCPGEPDPWSLPIVP
jgi:hypothetical protein